MQLVARGSSCLLEMSYCIFKRITSKWSQKSRVLIQSDWWIDITTAKTPHACAVASITVLCCEVSPVPGSIVCLSNCLAFIFVSVDPLVRYRNISHPFQNEDLRKILIWSETHFSACCAQTALFPILEVLRVIWEETVAICPQEARSGPHTVEVARPLLQWRRL